MSARDNCNEGSDLGEGALYDFECGISGDFEAWDDEAGLENCWPGVIERGFWPLFIGALLILLC